MQPVRAKAELWCSSALINQIDTKNVIFALPAVTVGSFFCAMQIDKIQIRNFKGFEDIEIPFDARFNLIIGDNGSGKTSILEALTVAMGSFFLGLKNTDARNIREADIRLSSLERNQEFQYPVEISAFGNVMGEEISWTRTLNSSNGNTLLNRPYKIKRIAEGLDAGIRQGAEVTMPVLAYYPTGRLWKDFAERNTGDTDRKVIASRLRAYKSCLQATSTFKIFLKWFIGKEQSAIMKKEEDYSLGIVKQLIVNNLPQCKDLYYEFDEDKIQGLKVALKDGRTLPFEYLSDGARNMFALLADIAYKCLVLNPHLKERVLADTNGIVLIDELDLHLHPDWQKVIVNTLKTCFPSIQFITTSHSPFLIQEMAEGQLIKLKGTQVYISGGDQLSLEDIAETKQEVDNPQWSDKKKELYSAAVNYYDALERGKTDDRMEMKLAELITPFSQNPAFDAYMQQIKLIKEHNHEAGK
jgi:predicted ATP-binding protein involved in virulence